MNSVQIGSARSATAPGTDPTAPVGLFASLGRFVVRRRRLTLIGYVVGLIVAGGLGSQVFGALQTAGYNDPGSQSARALTLTRDEFGTQDPTVVLAVASSSGVDSPAATTAATALIARVGALPDVTQTVSYWTSGRPAALRGSDGRTGQVLVYARGATLSQQTDLANRIIADVGGTRADGLTVQVGGFTAVGDAITKHVTSDLARAESIAVPITVVLLVVVFGGLVAAGLPFTVALGSIVGSFLVVWLITLTTDVSIFALNLITGLGLGLGIDYALLMVNRFREELKAGHSSDDAVIRTVATAGRTVAVSGATVAVVLAALLFFPQYFLKSFGYAGIAATVLAVLAALTALPASLAMLGPRIDRFKVRRGDLAPRDEGAWSSIARLVMRRPWPVLIAAVALLAALAFPALSAVFGQSDARVLPAADPAAQASVTLADRFPGQEGSPIDVVLPGQAGDPAGVAEYARALSLRPDVVRVTTPVSVLVHGAVLAPNGQPSTYIVGRDVRLSVIGDLAPRTAAAQTLIQDLRAVPAPTSARLIGGAAAEYTDAQAAIARAGVWALLWVGLATLIVLFLYTGSVVLPLKAVVLNVLSLSATLGVLVWVFQQGHGGWLVGSFMVTHSIDTSMAVLIAVTAFALSMDYEIFLLSRIKEEHDAGRDTTEAVAFGLQRSGRIITAAAVLLAVVFASFVSSGVTNIKELGLGVAFAILLDATVVRAFLVPAFMRLAGRWNWWAPRPLAALHRRIGLADG